MDTFYREELMEHYKHPQNKGSLTNPSVNIKEVNSMCGDEINLQLAVEDGKISDVAFDGSACSVSIVSSSMLTEFIKGKTLEEVQKIGKDELLELLGITLTTSRIKCATLCLDALAHALEKYESNSNS